jgi:hypothetical protein
MVRLKCRVSGWPAELVSRTVKAGMLAVAASVSAVLVACRARLTTVLLRSAYGRAEGAGVLR